MENNILKFFDERFKKYTKIGKIDDQGSSLSKDEYIHSLLMSVLTDSCFRISTFIPNEKNKWFYDLLSLDVGYRINTLKAFHLSHPIINESISQLSDNELIELTKIIESIKPEFIDLYKLFYDEFEAATFSEYHSVIVNKIHEIALKTNNSSKVSHPAKFTHPEAKYPRIYFKGDLCQNGFLLSGNAVVDFDMHINAPDLVVFKFLSVKIDGRPVLEYFEKNDVLPLMKLFNVDRDTVNIWKNEFFKASENSDQRTNKYMKQVYFPVNSGYHQLSILFSSGLSFKLKERVDYLNNQSPNSYAGKKLRENKKMFDGEFYSLFDITYQRHGGDHPKNISGLNNKYQNVYLLPNSPPRLNENYKYLPTFNFFSQTIWPKKYSDSFLSLHKLLNLDVNNLHVRQSRDNIIEFVTNEIIEAVWLIRQTKAGWTASERFAALPKYQKVMLDEAMSEERTLDENLVDQFVYEMARWFINAYKKILGDEALPFHDDELRHIQKLIHNSKENLV